MSAPARLLGLRVQGFKSFAERTLVEFGPGISAVVGPNGSGKSNLADALRWALGEQGRSLRIRKSEDVIWAGSERRSAQGMADVTLVLENGDALLPVEYAVVEGTGSIREDKGLTDRNGKSDTIYVAGRTPGRVSIEITVRSTVPTAAEIAKVNDTALAVTDYKFF